MSTEEKVARIRQATAIMELATVMMEMPWFQKLMNDAAMAGMTKKEAKP